jgi:hypothetical protein
MEEDEAGELPEAVPSNVEVEPKVLDVAHEEPATTPELMLPDEPDTFEEPVEPPGEPGNAEMGPEGTVDSPPDSAEPVLPVVDSMGDELYPGDPTVEAPPLPDDPALEMPEEPQTEPFDLSEWGIQSTFDYSGGQRLQGRERVIDVNLSIPDGFEEELSKHIEPQMGMLRSQVMDHTANVIEESALLGSTTGVPY